MLFACNLSRRINNAFLSLPVYYHLSPESGLLHHLRSPLSHHLFVAHIFGAGKGLPQRHRHSTRVAQIRATAKGGKGGQSEEKNQEPA